MSLTDYELQRLANIERNNETLAALGLGGGFELAPKNPIKRRPKPENKPPPAPTRRSGRLAQEEAAHVFIENESGGTGTKCVVTVGGDKAALGETATASASQQLSALEAYAEGYMPEGEDDLLEGEQAAFEALREAKREKSRELSIEGYKVAQHRTLCELVRRRCRTIADLRECWGFGGAGVRVTKYGALFLAALAPFLEDLECIHAAATIAAEEAAASDAASPGRGEQPGQGLHHDGPSVASTTGGRGETDERLLFSSMPVGMDDLLPGERAAAEALVTATHERAEATGQGKFYWNVAPMRSLCEMVRRRPRTLSELSACRGLGGKGVKVQKHGAFLLAALVPFLADLEAVHEATFGPSTQALDESSAQEENRATMHQGQTAPPPLPPAGRSQGDDDEEEEDNEPLRERRARQMRKRPSPRTDAHHQKQSKLLPSEEQEGTSEQERPRVRQTRHSRP